ncbi:MAG TPA: hypothetical protein VML75_02760 [Kofleriaceae bacterium]|nr:hypothetical protein [Kofleriaceae bacterium]
MNKNGSTTITDNPAEAGRERAQGMAKRANEGIDHAATRVSAGFDRTAEGLRSTSDKVASKLEGAGEYLRDSDAKSMGQDVTNLIRRHPKASIMVGLGLGFLVYRLLSR